MASVQIILTIGGQEVDNAIANMTDQALGAAVQAIASHYGYTNTIPNPDFDPTQPVSSGNPTTIPNVSMYRFFSYQLRRFVEEHTKKFVLDQGQASGVNQALTQYNSLAGTINII